MVLGTDPTVWVGRPMLALSSRCRPIPLGTRWICTLKSRGNSAARRLGHSEEHSGTFKAVHKHGTLAHIGAGPSISVADQSIL